MITWIKPAVGWGIRDKRKSAMVHSFEIEKPLTCFRPTHIPIRVALVPYAVARKAGLLRRPKP